MKNSFQCKFVCKRVKKADIFSFQTILVENTNFRYFSNQKYFKIVQFLCQFFENYFRYRKYRENSRTRNAKYSLKIETFYKKANVLILGYLKYAKLNAKYFKFLRIL